MLIVLIVCILPVHCVHSAYCIVWIFPHCAGVKNAAETSQTVYRESVRPALDNFSVGAQQVRETTTFLVVAFYCRGGGLKGLSTNPTYSYTAARARPRLTSTSLETTVIHGYVMIIFVFWQLQCGLRLVPTLTPVVTAVLYVPVHIGGHR